MTIDRRNLIKFGALGLAGTATRWAPAARVGARLGSATGGRAPNAQAQLLIIYLRGANDGVHTVIPINDPTYERARRSIKFTAGDGLISVPGVLYSRLHPAFSRVAGPNSPTSGGDIAWVHQIGNPFGKRSHFTEQQISESAKPGTIAELDPFGFVARMIAVGRQHGGANWDGLIPAISLAPRPQRLFATDDSQAFSVHTPALGKYGLKDLAGGGNLALKAQLETALAPHFDAYQTTGSEISKLVARSGDYFLDTAGPVQQQLADTFTHNVPAFGLGPTAPNDPSPEDGTLPFQPPGNAFLSSVEEAVHVLNAMPQCRVAGVDFGGFDTHGNQRPEHDNLLEYLAKALAGIWQLANANVLTLVISEFGRTAKANSSKGTDHGVGGLSVVMNSAATTPLTRVRGGTYNCYDLLKGASEFGHTWRKLLAPPSSADFENACEVKTDFRALYAEILDKHFGFQTPDIATILQGYSYYPSGGAPLPQDDPLDTLL